MTATITDGACSGVLKDPECACGMTIYEVKDIQHGLLETISGVGYSRDFAIDLGGCVWRI